MSVSFLGLYAPQNGLGVKPPAQRFTNIERFEPVRYKDQAIFFAHYAPSLSSAWVPRLNGHKGMTRGLNSLPVRYARCVDPKAGSGESRMSVLLYQHPGKR